MKGPKGCLDMLTGGLKLVSGILNLVSGILNSARDDFGCDWYCDNCNDYMNSQLGFRAGSTWTCRKCGYENDVSENSTIYSTYFTDDGLEVLDIPAMDIEDLDDY